MVNPLRQNTAGLDPPRCTRKSLGTDWPSFPHKLSHYNFNLTLMKFYELVFFQRTSDINPWIWGVSIFSNFKSSDGPGGPAALGRLEASCGGCVDRRTRPWNPWGRHETYRERPSKDLEKTWYPLVHTKNHRKSQFW